MLRSVRTFAAHEEAVGFSVAGLVLLDDENLAAVASPLGSAVRRRAGVGSGPNGRLVLLEDWDGSNIEDKWFGAPVVRVHRKGTPRSDWRPDWYVNLELSWVRTPISFDSQDWALDVVASTEPDGT